MKAERADIQNVLAQMRALKTQAQQGVQPAEAPGAMAGVDPASKIEPGSFGNLLKRAIDSVNDAQSASSKLVTAYEKGDPSVDLPQVMIGLQKASVSFQAMTQVRNRLVSAYEDISKMPI
ncbi:flagellar hook-basal body complex protein FliE [Motiliproteus sp.]|uniref:flagellar hook-basal body complex protein FliE n=1 Tax=Motiliproteus sp. TaxID=1898955 RepID=UPI003BAA5936